MLGLPGWVWLGLAIIAVYRIGLFAMSRAFRGVVRREFVGFAREFDPEIPIAQASGSRIELSGPEGARTFDLGPLFKDVSALDSQTPDARRRVYWEHLKRLHEARGAGRPLLDLERQGPRIRPRLVGPELFQTLAAGREVPSRLLGATGLSVVYALDGERTMTLITAEMAGSLGLDADRLHELAVENLAGRFPAQAVRDVVEEDVGTVLQVRDGYDPARILVVPRHLRPGEAVAAALPDANSLILAPVPADGDWSKLWEAARTPLGPGAPLLDRPLRVTADAIEPA